MPKIFGVEIDSIMFYLLYLILLAFVILEHNVIDIIYFFTLTIYLIRLFLINRKKKKKLACWGVIAMFSFFIYNFLKGGVYVYWYTLSFK